MEGEEINKTEEKKTYCLCRLPVDVLEIILRYLSVLDYIKFRAVSKCWRLAFSTCASSSSIMLQQRPERELPWFVVLKTKPVGRKHRGCPVKTNSSSKLVNKRQTVRDLKSILFTSLHRAMPLDLRGQPQHIRNWDEKLQFRILEKTITILHLCFFCPR
ncbi:F-box domain - like 10 [Theobroma cacao]|nr:F-box domain - like 10 [Theobroma cacao]